MTYAEFERTWSTQRWEEWAATCAPGYTFYPYPELALDRDQTLAWSRAWFSAFPDYTQEIVREHTTDGSTAAELTARGTSTGDFVLFGRVVIPATGRRFEIPYVKILSFDADGLVVDDRQYQDRLELFSQLGLQYNDR